jgi:hypothetical protein
VVESYCRIIGLVGEEEANQSILHKVINTDRFSEMVHTAAREALRLISDRSERITATQVDEAECQLFRPGMFVEAHSLSKVEFNGRRGLVKGIQDCLVQVVFDDAACGCVALRPSNLRCVEDKSETPPSQTVITSFGNKDDFHAEEEVKLRLALEMDEIEQTDREAADLARAIQLSKADSLQEELVLLQLTRQARSVKVSEQLGGASQLAPCRQLVADAGCQLQPDWAGGAWLLAPLTRPQLSALLEDCPNITLQDHHVLVRNRDIDCVRSALSELPRRMRPNVKMESRLRPGDTSADQGTSCGPISGSVPVSKPASSLTHTPTSFAELSLNDEVPSAQAGDGMAIACKAHLDLQEEPVFIVEKTFVGGACNKPKATLQDSETLHSAPCGNSISKQPLNPRRFV